MPKFYEMIFDSKRVGGEGLDLPRVPGEEAGDHTRFLKPERLDLPQPLVVSIDQSGRPADMYYTMMSIWVVSPYIAQIVDRIAGPAEVQRIRCVTTTGRQLEIIHQLLHLECLDLPHCHGVLLMDEKEIQLKEKYATIKPHPPFVKYIRRIAIQSHKAANHHCFRIKGYEIATLVSEELKRELENNLITGAEFRPIYSDP
jgi:hypothetical protein